MNSQISFKSVYLKIAILKMKQKKIAMRTHLLPCLSNNDAMSILFRDMMHIAKCIKIASRYFFVNLQLVFLLLKKIFEKSTHPTVITPT